MNLVAILRCETQTVSLLTGEHHSGYNSTGILEREITMTFLITSKSCYLTLHTQIAQPRFPADQILDPAIEFLNCIYIILWHYRFLPFLLVLQEVHSQICLLRHHNISLQVQPPRLWLPSQEWSHHKLPHIHQV